MEQIFTLVYHGKFSFEDAYRLPIIMRRWFTERIVKEVNEEREQINQNGNTSTGISTMPPSLMSSIRKT